MGHMTRVQTCNWKGEVLSKKSFSYMCAYNNLPILKCHGYSTYFWQSSSILKHQGVAVNTLIGNDFLINVAFTNKCVI